MFSLNSYELKIMGKIKVISVNASFIFSSNFDGLFIYSIDYPDEKSINIKMSEYPFLLEVHPFYDELFLTSSNNEIQIWEISKLNKKCLEKILIKGHTNSIVWVVFCEDESKFLASYSKDKTIKIWNFEKPFCINSISINKFILGIKLFLKYLIYIEKDNIVIYDNMYLTIKNRIPIKIDEGNIIIPCNENKFILLKPGEINVCCNG